MATLKKPDMDDLTKALLKKDKHISKAEIKKIKAQFNQAKKRFGEFTGHSIKWLEFEKAFNSLAETTGDHVWFHVGQLDYLMIEPIKKANASGIKFQGWEIRFRTLLYEYEPNTYPLLIKYNGKQFATILPPNNDLTPKLTKIGVGVAQVYAIGYTTVRDGKLISYNHDFKDFARPQLDFKTCKNIILSLGGGFEFTDSGFNDKRK